MSEKYAMELKILTAEHNDNWLEIYTPSGINHSEIYDFFVTIKLKSINVLPPILKPEGVEFMNESEEDKAWQHATKDAQKKILSVNYQKGSTIVNSTEFVIMRVEPSYTENLLPFLTWHSTLRFPNGCKILAKIDNLNSGLLAGEDRLEFRLIAREFNHPSIQELANTYIV